jgi:phenylalanine-4-hydroxylase
MATDPILPAEFTATQDWDGYTPDDHGTWEILYNRQMDLLQSRACPEYLTGVRTLAFDAKTIPDYRILNEILMQKTGWQIAVVPCFIPANLFFALLAERQFPATAWIRRRDQLDYLPEPDMFHDVIGHMPMLTDPIFADYMQEFGKAGLHAEAVGMLDAIQRLYWFTVEFGLVQTKSGIKIYGSGILSSMGESIYALESPKPHRLRFDMGRVMRTTYHIDAFQKTYFVIDSFGQLLDACRRDFAPLYQSLPGLPTVHWDRLLPGDDVLHRGTVGS